MKYIKARKNLIFTLNPLFLLLGIWVFWELSAPALIYYKSFWLSAALVLLLIITPWSSKRLASSNEALPDRLPCLNWLSRVVLLEIAMLAAYLGICSLISHSFPVDTHVRPHLFAQSLKTTLLDFGLFPWTLYAIIAAGMGIVAYRQSTNAYFSKLLRPFTKEDLQHTMSLAINISARRCTLFVFSITLMFLALSFISFIVPLGIQLPYGVQPAALLTTLVLLLTSFSQKFKHYLSHIFSRNIPTALSLPVFALVFAITILLLSTVFSGFMQHNTEKLSIPTIITLVIQRDWHTAWMLFSGLWWLCFTPAVCSYIAGISEGYRARDVMLAVIALPILISLLILFQQHTQMTWPHFPHALIKVFGLLGFLVFLPTLFNHDTSANMIFSYFPRNGVIKHRDHQPFFQRSMQLAVVALYFYLVVGMNGLSLFLFSFTFLALVTVHFVVFAIVNNLRLK